MDRDTMAKHLIANDIEKIKKEFIKDKEIASLYGMRVDLNDLEMLLVALYHDRNFKIFELENKIRIMKYS